jgi:hypothetical protein
MKSIDVDTTFDNASIENNSRLDTSQIMRDADNNSIFGGHYRPKLALNNNTTIELASPVPEDKGRNSSVKSPFNNRKALAASK